MTDQRYPLHWPAGWPRTKSPTGSRFKVTPDRARRGLLHEIQRLGGKGIVISTNMRLRTDGQPMMSQREPEDSGVAVYFERDGKRLAFACDRFFYVHDNMHAIAKTIEAIRGIERWGASDMMERAFTGFEALPAPGAGRDWRDVLTIIGPLSGSPHPPRTLSDAEAVFRALVKEYHPDRVGGGDPAKMREAAEAIEAARKHFRGGA